jgi:dihydrofolate reductase
VEPTQPTHTRRRCALRALVYFVAVTLDGRIAGPDGQTDFFPTDEPYLAWLAEHWGDGLPTPFHEAMGTTPPRTRWDTVVMGRGTFEPAVSAGLASPYAHLEQFVFSTSLDPAEHPGVRVVAEDPLPFVRDLKAGEGGDIWLCGGGALAGALAPEIDRLVLKLNPVLAGDGVPLVGHGFDPSRWTLVEHEVLPGGVLLLTYDRAGTASAAVRPD